MLEKPFDMIKRIKFSDSDVFDLIVWIVKNKPDWYLEAWKISKKDR